MQIGVNPYSPASELPKDWFKLVLPYLCETSVVGKRVRFIVIEILFD